MPKRTLYTLSWSSEKNTYELTLDGRSFQCFSAADEQSWLTWLTAHPAFLFQGHAGSLRAYKESRSRGGDYWYAYHFTDRSLRKCYLGRSTSLSFARLEEIARRLQERSALPTPAAAPQTAAASQDNAVLPFLHSSLRVPRVPRTLIERPRLLKQLDAALSHPLTVLSAPAGSGKTTLLSAWAALRPHQVAWLSLENLDNEQTRFWLSIILALRTCLTGVGEVALMLLQAPQPASVSIILTTLLNELASLRQEIVLILDDYHVIEETALHEALFFFLEHLPANLHLILSTRVDPDFPLSRWRARGQLIEIRAADLRFTTPEASLFLTEVMGLSLSEEQSGIVEQRTEGWIAGLQLTALSLQKQDDPSAFLQHLRGSHRFLLDYMQEEILQHQSLHMQRFLLQTAILTRLNAALCQAVTGEPGCQEVLEDVERSNLFLVPLDEERQRYRFHELFREALLTRLRASQPEQVPLLHRRAATWYEAQGFLQEAITHALEAEDAAYAADLIERVILPQSWRNEFPTLRRWLAHLPRNVLQERPWLGLTYASAVASTSPLGPGLLDEAKDPLELAEQGYRARGDQAGLGGALTLRAILLVYQGAFPEGLALAEQALALLPASEQQWRMAALTLAGMGATFTGQPIQARELLLQSQALAEATGSFIGKMANTILLGNGCISRGELQQAARYFHQALTTLDDQPGFTRMQIRLTLGAGEEPYYEQLALYGLATLFYEWNDLQRAQQYMQEAMQKPFQTLFFVLIPGLLLQVRLQLACGKVQAAQQRLEERIVQELRPEILRELHLCQAYLAFRCGERAKVEQWATTFAQEAEHSSLLRREEEILLLARFRITEGQPDTVLDLLASWKQEAHRTQRLQSELQILVVEALAFEAKGARLRARETLLQALRLARPEHYHRLFLDEGPAMAALLNTLLPDTGEKELTQYVRTLLRAFSEEGRPSSRAGSEPSLLIEPLTQRELEILRELADGASNQDIADRLVISLATVKKHVSNVLSKLGARNRVDAIARAREQRLFDEH
jgi:LuxR family transcriptional regulator, maltose regulon positive regulatory protein